MAAYYNEFDPKAAAWLRELISAGHIAPGFVDERSIADVRAEQLEGFTQCHFFAGIGGWSHALRLAGWSDDRPVWTGSPPCQPFSNAGKQKAQSDARHLWPVFFNLIKKCAPPTILGEQVEAAIRTGWLDDLQDDLEAQGYATGKTVLPACSVGAPHIRQRIWFVAERVADSSSQGLEGHRKPGQRHGSEGRQEPTGLCAESSAHGRLAEPGQFTEGCENKPERTPDNPARSGSESRMGDPEHPGLHGTEMPRSIATPSNGGEEGPKFSSEPTRTGSAVVSGALRFWENPDWLYCRDGKWRPVEPRTFPLANGVSGRVGLLRGYGNAIVPEVAAEVIKGYMSL